MHYGARLFNPTSSHWPMYPAYNYPVASQSPPLPSAPVPSFGMRNTLPTSCQQIGGSRSPSYTNTAPSMYRGNVSSLPAYGYANPWQVTLPSSLYAYPSLTSSGSNVVLSGPSAFLATETNSGFTGNYPTRLASFSAPGLETILIAILALVALDLVIVRPHKYAAISEH